MPTIWKEDIIEPQVTVSSEGKITVPTAPGIGFEVKESMIKKLAIRQENLSLNGIIQAKV